MDLKELLRNPRTAPFSRLKYLARYANDEQIAEFLNGLFNVAAEARYSGDWTPLEEFLDRWEDVAIGGQFQSMGVAEADSIPWVRLAKPIRECRIAVVTTGGVYVEGQVPYSRTDDISYREVPRDTPTSRLRIWHPGYDNGPASQDINCIFPVDRFRELEAEGLIGGLAQTAYSFMGLINSHQALSAETAPEVAERLRQDGVDAVFLAST